jgi:membrane-associated phospholipid phosphatase
MLRSEPEGDGLVRRTRVRRAMHRGLGVVRRRWIALVVHPRVTEAWRYLRPILRVPDDWRSLYGRFWLELTVGSVALVAAAWLFGILAEDVVTGAPLTVTDATLARWLYAHAAPRATRAMFAATELGGPTMITSVTLATAAVLMWRRRWPWLLTLILVVPGGALLNEVIKIAFHRARPKFDVPILAVKGYGFPSGHAMMATLLYGLLAVLLVRTLRDVRWCMLVVGVAGLVVVLVGISRMYLGAHYLSDILAAVAAGVAWLVLCLTAVATLRYHRRRRQ